MIWASHTHTHTHTHTHVRFSRIVQSAEHTIFTLHLVHIQGIIVMQSIMQYCDAKQVVMAQEYHFLSHCFAVHHPL